MKNNQLSGMLLALTLLSTLASVGLTLKYNHSLHQLQRLQPQLANANAARSIIQSILTDTFEYSKTHPDILHVVQPYINKPGSTPAAAPAPAPAATKSAK